MNKSLFDKISIGASLICAVHCVLLPLFLTSLTIFNIELLENQYLEILTIAVSLLIGGWAVWSGYRRHHHQFAIVILFLLGMAAILVSNLPISKPAEIGLKVVGATLLITAHVRNWKKCKHSSRCQIK